MAGISAILLILAPMDDALPDTRQRAICRLEWANITNVARKQLTFVFYWKKQFKNQRRVWKHIILIVFVYHRIRSSILRLVHLLNIFGIKWSPVLQRYINIPFGTCVPCPSFFVSAVMLTNPWIALPLFIWPDWMPITTSLGLHGKLEIITEEIWW